MTEDQFLKRSYKPFMEIDFMVPGTDNRRHGIPRDQGNYVTMYLTAVNFDERLFRLANVPEGYETDPEEFWVRCDHCEIPKKPPQRQKLKVVL